MNILSRYLGLVRFSHTFFALPFVLLAYGMALKWNLSEKPQISFRGLDLFGILLCMVFARSAAMGFNRLVDRKIDADNPRTAQRHIPSGMLSATNVLCFVLICSLGFVVSTLLFLPNNSIPIWASVPVLLFLLGYSYTKRWTILAHFWLGTALMLAPLAAWIVARPILVPLPIPPLLLGLAVLLWTAGFDLIYATQDAEVDKQQGLHSMPGKYGIAAALRLSALCHAAALILWGMLPFFYKPFGMIYGIGLGLSAAILLAEHLLVMPRHIPAKEKDSKQGEPQDLQRINVAFFHLNIIISIGLSALGIVDLLR